MLKIQVSPEYFYSIFDNWINVRTQQVISGIFLKRICASVHIHNTILPGLSRLYERQCICWNCLSHLYHYSFKDAKRANFGVHTSHTRCYVIWHMWKQVTVFIEERVLVPVKMLSNANKCHLWIIAATAVLRPLVPGHFINIFVKSNLNTHDLLFQVTERHFRRMIGLCQHSLSTCYVVCPKSISMPCTILMYFYFNTRWNDLRSLSEKQFKNVTT